MEAKCRMSSPPPVSAGRLIDHADVVRRRLVVLHPPAVHETQAVVLHQSPHRPPRVLGLLLPPAHEVRLQAAQQARGQPARVRRPVSRMQLPNEMLSLRTTITSWTNIAG